MATKLPAKDVVIIGLGWTAAILAHELTDQGLDVVAIERGPWRDTATSFNIGYAPDELRYAVRMDLFQRPAQSTYTFRNNDSQTALPIRQWGSFQPGNGVGGAGVHWNGWTWRFQPTDFRLRSHLTERYGTNFIPDELAIQDWGITYEELEPFYEKFEYLAGISGKAGNLNGVIETGGNPFEGARKREYRCRQCRCFTRHPYLRRPRGRSGFIHSRYPRQICRAPTPTRSASKWHNALSAVSASGSVAPITRRRVHKPQYCPC